MTQALIEETVGKKRKLTDREERQFNDYLLQIRGWIRQNNPTTHDLINLCLVNLKIQVTTGMVTYRVGPEGTLYKHNWPGTEISKKGRATSKQVLNTLIQGIAAQQAWLTRLYTELVQYGHPLPALPNIPNLKELCAQAQEELDRADLRDDEEK
jgi:hypothetical protein